MEDFHFHRPESVAAAVAAQKQAREAKYLGGGQSLIPVMKLGLAAPSDLVSLAALKELKGIRREGKDLVVGGGVTHAEVAESKRGEGPREVLAHVEEGHALKKAGAHA